MLVPTSKHLTGLMTWFADKDSLSKWAGPHFRYPFNEQTFIEDLNLQKLSSYILIDDFEQLVGFGQYYQRLNKCHLARIAISPEHRGKGIAKILLKQLIQKAKNDLSLDVVSLFVLADNVQAVKAYQSYGFSVTEYPDIIELPNCLYMTLNN
nr:GNAT family N-acetyltransferase [Shewanella olleyana]